MTKKYHRAFGVYGIIGDQNSLVVIKKNGGPYKNRYDLPGGSLEDGESLSNAIIREIREETALTAVKLTQLGVTSFKYPLDYKLWHYNQHICVFYRVENVEGAIAASAAQFIGQDSLGAKKIPLAQLTLDNTSPLVLKAKQFLQNGEHFEPEDTSYSHWEVLERPVF